MTALGYKQEGKGAKLVLIHGYLGGSDMWLDQIEYFQSQYEVIAIDLPGFGDSNTIQAHKSINDIASDVLRLLTTLGVEQFALLGHSMGGMVVQQMVALAPSRVTKLICYGTGPVGILPGRFETIEQSRIRMLTDGVEKTGCQIAATWFVDGERHPRFELCKDLIRRVSMDTALNSLKAWEGWDGRSTLSDIACDTLIIWGDRDQSYDWSQPEALWRSIENSQLSVLPGCAHNAHLEKPDIFNAVLADFLSAKTAQQTIRLKEKA